jgi:hypothetical protein
MASISTHPYRAAWEKRDLDAWLDALAADVVLWSPILRTPFRGQVAAAELFDILFSAFGDVRITHEFASDDVSAFFWRADINGRVIEGTDLIKNNEEGKISEIRVLIRPLIDIATFAAAVGPPLARRRGRVRGLVARLLSAPLRPLLAAIDYMASRLSQRR